MPTSTRKGSTPSDVFCVFFVATSMVTCNDNNKKMRTILLHVLRDFRFELGKALAPGNPAGYDAETMMQGVRCHSLRRRGRMRNTYV